MKKIISFFMIIITSINYVTVQNPKKFTVADYVRLQEFISETTECIPIKKEYDLTNDNCLNIFDLIMMRRILININS